MCGIFGLITRADSGYSCDAWNKAIAQLFTLSQTRGKEAAGIAIATPSRLSIYKDSVMATEMLKTVEYKAAVDRALEGSFDANSKIQVPIGAIGHSRLVTNGLQGIDANNQPVLHGDVAVVHNGIVVNVDELWQVHPDITSSSDVDTEVFAALVHKGRKLGKNPLEATRDAFAQIRGEASIAILLRDADLMVLGTNTGSLYVATASDQTALFFASERYICEKLVRETKALNGFSGAQITQVRPGMGISIEISSLRVTEFPLQGQVAVPQVSSSLGVQRTIEDKARRYIDLRLSLRRCTRCVLPETMPYIAFDSEGVCNYCHNYQPQKLGSEDELEAAFDRQRSRDGSPDCLVAFSGGRDSSFGLHLLKAKYRMNPIAYTYDWGMVTDLARRNQARICGKLGIEHIWLSADIKAKRANIRRNVLAWLKKPDLGMIPLFMAGDKQFFYYANQMIQQTGIKSMVFCTNRLEKTDFKTGFIGIRPAEAAMRNSPSTSGAAAKLNLAWQYGRRFLGNPAYLNRSLADTMFAFFSYYLISQNHIYMFDHYRWDEEEINSVLLGEYDWEKASDTNSTWRIGDGTAPFYNYIYLTVAGFTEHDTFRSNQIREGQISRDEALRSIEEENVPRWQSIREYTQMINIDFDEAIRVIDRLPKLYVPA